MGTDASGCETLTFTMDHSAAFSALAALVGKVGAFEKSP